MYGIVLAELLHTSRINLIQSALKSLAESSGMAIFASGRSVVFVMKRFISLLCGVIALSHSCNNKTVSYSGDLGEFKSPKEQVIYFDTVRVRGDTVRLCSPILTSIDHISKVREDDKDGYGCSPHGMTFFEPGNDIRGNDLVKTAKDHFNYALIGDMIKDDFEWMLRELADISLGLIDLDTSELAEKHILIISDDNLQKVITNPRLRKLAKDVINCYNRQNGEFDDNGDVMFTNSIGWKNYIDNNAPISSQEIFDEYKKSFWLWYDKAKHVPEIENMMRLRVNDSIPTLSEDRKKRYDNVVLKEKDINRRTILAIELVHYSDYSAFFILGEILESGIYTKYLPEAFIVWRTLAQKHWFGYSTSSMIPNDYYNQVKQKCVDTILRHYLSTNDPYDLGLMDYLTNCGILRRFGGIYGNEVAIWEMSVKQFLFLPPSILGYDILEEI